MSVKFSQREGRYRLEVLINCYAKSLHETKAEIVAHQSKQGAPPVAVLLVDKRICHAEDFLSFMADLLKIERGITHIILTGNAPFAILPAIMSDAGANLEKLSLYELDLDCKKGKTENIIKAISEGPVVQSMDFSRVALYIENPRAVGRVQWETVAMGSLILRDILPNYPIKHLKMNDYIVSEDDTGRSFHYTTDQWSQMLTQPKLENLEIRLMRGASWCELVDALPGSTVRELTLEDVEVDLCFYNSLARYLRNPDARLRVLHITVEAFLKPKYHDQTHLNPWGDEDRQEYAEMFSVLANGLKNNLSLKSFHMVAGKFSRVADDVPEEMSFNRRFIQEFVPSFKQNTTLTDFYLVNPRVSEMMDARRDLTDADIEIRMYLKLNKADRGQLLRGGWEQDPSQLLDALGKVAGDLNCLFYLLHHSTPLLCGCIESLEGKLSGATRVRNIDDSITSLLPPKQRRRN